MYILYILPNILFFFYGDNIAYHPKCNALISKEGPARLQLDAHRTHISMSPSHLHRGNWRLVKIEMQKHCPILRHVLWARNDIYSTVVLSGDQTQDGALSNRQLRVWDPQWLLQSLWRVQIEGQPGAVYQYLNFFFFFMFFFSFSLVSLLTACHSSFTVKLFYRWNSVTWLFIHRS